MMTTLFWSAFLILLYIYIGYPALVWALARLFGREPVRKPITPTVSLLIPAYNEDAHIEAKLRNSLALNYPKDKLDIVVASDGSTDRTNAIVSGFKAQGVTLLLMRDNIGKSAMLTRTVPLLRGEIIVFSDASSELEPDALRYLVRSFADRQVGCVSGLYRLKGSSDLRGEGEGLYWTYETFIKRQESRLHSILGAHGAFYAIRKERFERLGEATINDDYIIPMRIVAQGYRAVYDPAAVSWEREHASVEGEFARRRRIAAGNCQQIIELRGMLSPWHGWVALSFFSHKVLRTLAPLFMLTLLLSSLWVPSPWGPLFLSIQALFYLSAWAGYLVQRSGRMVKWLSPPLYFCMGNLAMLAGLLRFCFSRRRVAWDRSR
ncbi:MAG: glycosyltransferase family 2 protein [Candidatus Omnitrophica bacterium]|nr:glycosyltransferase family 2 protein [Candidatus Omnitrophota bacterium]